MSLDPLSSISILSEIAGLFKSLANGLTKVRGTKKRHVGKELVKLFHILNDVERYTASAVPKIRTLKKNPVAVEWTISQEDGLGLKAVPGEIVDVLSYLDAIELLCKRFLDWASRNKQMITALGVHSSEIHETLTTITAIEQNLLFEGNTYEAEHYYEYGSDLRISGIETLRRKIESGELKQIVEVEKGMRFLASSVRDTKDAIRTFAVNNLTVEDVL